MDALIHSMKAAGEPTRLRILLLLDRSELTVSEICRILGQSQPRISRHLKLLCDAGLLVRRAEGTNAFYRHAPEPFARQFFGAIRPLADVDSEVVVRDRQQLAQVRADRAELAARSFAKVAEEAALLEGRKAPADDVERAMLDAVGDRPINLLLDIGTGTGRVLELFAPQIETGIGIELNREMLNLARSQLDAAGLDHCSVRYGNAYNLEIGTGTVGLAVLHDVLHYLDEPARAIEQASHALDIDGRLLIVDFSAHKIEDLRADHAHRRLGFTDAEVIEWCETAGLTVVSLSHLTPPHPIRIDDEQLTVTIWKAGRSPTALRSTEPNP
ncbi:MAG: metalloregulator ArsR/SmtB family transcription factor [Acidimicrobiia bacterium]|nr:metalloregulator ArsR/SmtB family transcription factor [Acidimicrobiia bacterium]